MSTDFTTGRNTQIGKDDLYLKISDVMSKYLGVNRQTLYQNYINAGKCDGNGNWALYNRYNTNDIDNGCIDSNTYTDNDVDDLVVLKASIEKEALLDKDPSTAENRKQIIENACSALINDGLCNNFSLTGAFPHLDMPDSVISIDIDGTIKCIENIQNNEFANAHAIIKYTDSCGCGIQEPVPYYPPGQAYENPFIKDTKDDAIYGINASYLWEITGEEDIVVSDATSSMIENHLELATGTTATNSRIRISLTYTEN
jgi:hypothetical protein